MSYARITVLTSLAMIAFAGNSLLCRAALNDTGIDAASFTIIRLASGALTLWLVVQMRRGTYTGGGNWLSAVALFAYAAGFSFAYVSLPAATGALLLFGAVQATMIGYGIWAGERLRKAAAHWPGARLRRTSWPVAAGPLRAAAVWLRIDARCWRCMGYLFLARQRCWRSHPGNGGEFPARRSCRGSIQRDNAKQCCTG